MRGGLGQFREAIDSALPLGEPARRGFLLPHTSPALAAGRNTESQEVSKAADTEAESLSASVQPCGKPPPLPTSRPAWDSASASVVSPTIRRKLSPLWSASSTALFRVVYSLPQITEGEIEFAEISGSDGSILPVFQRNTSLQSSLQWLNCFGQSPEGAQAKPCLIQDKRLDTRQAVPGQDSARAGRKNCPKRLGQRRMRRAFWC